VTPPTTSSTTPTPIETWNGLLRPDVELSADYWQELSARMRDARLTFGERFLCPFLRPFFLNDADEHRVRHVAEAMAAIGEKVVQAALAKPELLQALGLTPDEERLVRIAPGYKTASTASRLDAFLLPTSLHFAEYNAESPAGPAYTQRLCELFESLPLMERFRAGRTVRFHAPIPPLLDALLASYREWGGTADPPQVAIVDWSEVPTWSEFELLRDAFVTAGVPTLVCETCSSMAPLWRPQAGR
jgi:hypothetical protein